MGVDVLERAAEERGRFLRVERLLAPDGHGETLRAPGYLLTFDVGRVLVAADPKHERLLVRHIENASEVADLRLESLVEEEPWWRVVGNPITRVWPGADGADAAVTADAVCDLRIQFREDAANPRVISLKYETGAVRVGEESADVR